MPMIIRKDTPRKTVAVDLDQTLAHTLEALVAWHNQVYHTQFTPADFDTYDYSRVWGGSREEACFKMREFYESEHFDHIEPIRDYALEALKALKKRKFVLIIITSRQQFIAEATKKFVDKHYPGIFESIYFCNLDLSDTEQLEYVSKPKSAICQEIGVDVLIDDGLDHALDCAALGIDVLLYDRKGQYGWNHIKPSMHKRTMTAMSRQLYHHSSITTLPANVTRVSSWKDIMARFPKPSSPLRYCYYPEDLHPSEDDQDEEDEEDEEASEQDEDDEGAYYPHYQHHAQNRFETIEVDVISEDEEEDEDEEGDGGYSYGHRHMARNSKHRYEDDDEDEDMWA